MGLFNNVAAAVTSMSMALGTTQEAGASSTAQEVDRTTLSPDSSAGLPTTSEDVLASLGGLSPFGGSVNAGIANDLNKNIEQAVTSLQESLDSMGKSFTSTFEVKPADGTSIEVTIAAAGGEKETLLLTSGQAASLLKALTQMQSINGDAEAIANHLSQRIDQQVTQEKERLRASPEGLAQSVDDYLDTQASAQRDRIANLDPEVLERMHRIETVRYLKETLRNPDSLNRDMVAERVTEPRAPEPATRRVLGGIAPREVPVAPEQGADELSAARLELARLEGKRGVDSDPQASASDTEKAQAQARALVDNLLTNPDRIPQSADVETRLLHETYSRLEERVEFGKDELYGKYSIVAPGFRNYSIYTEQPNFERGLLNILRYTERSIEREPLGRVEINPEADLDAMSPTELRFHMAYLEQALYEREGREIVYIELEKGLGLVSNRGGRVQRGVPAQSVTERDPLEVDNRTFEDVSRGINQALPRMLQRAIARGEGVFSFDRRITAHAQDTQYTAQQLERELNRSSREVQHELQRLLRSQYQLIDRLNRDHSYDFLSDVVKKGTILIDSGTSEAKDLLKRVNDAKEWDVEDIAFRAIREGATSVAPKTLIDQQFAKDLGRRFDPRLSNMSDGELRAEAALMAQRLGNYAGLLNDRETRIAQLSLEDTQVDAVISLEQRAAQEALVRAGFSRHAVAYTSNTVGSIETAEQALENLQNTAYMLMRMNQEIQQINRDYDHWARSNRNAIFRRFGESVSDGVRRIPEQAGRRVTDRVGDIINEQIDRVLKR